MIIVEKLVKLVSLIINVLGCNIYENLVGEKEVHILRVLF